MKKIVLRTVLAGWMAMTITQCSDTAQAAPQTGSQNRTYVGPSNQLPKSPRTVGTNPLVRDKRTPTASQADQSAPTFAPPANRVEKPKPKPGFVWITGRYEWKQGRYVWISGHWERAKANQRWIPGHWVFKNGRYIWIEGRWVPGTPPAPKRQTVKLVEFPVNKFGAQFWTHRNGDTEMRTKSSKRAAAGYSSRLEIVGDTVQLKLYFSALEIEGDRTAFYGELPCTVFRAPTGKRIVGLRTVSNSAPQKTLEQTGSVVKYGEQHGLKPFPAVANPIWRNLLYTVDSRGKDAADIGISGVLNFYVVLE